MNVDTHSHQERTTTHPNLIENLGITVLLGVGVLSVTHCAMIPLSALMSGMIMMIREMAESVDKLGIQAAGSVMGRTPAQDVQIDSWNRPTLWRHAQIVSQPKWTNGDHRIHE